MAGTQATTTDDGTTYTELAEAMRSDEPQDSRECPHECHGSLSVKDDDTVLCESCRCTPDGVYLPPDTERGDGTPVKSACSQYTFFCCEGSFPMFYPHPWANEDRERYRHSGAVRLVGGFTEAWPHERTSREDSLL
jgi:hypothetical protein